jgi:putative transposase
MDSSSLSHTKWKCQYHIVFIPKYRRKVLYGKIKVDVREILIKLCKYKNVEIIEGAVCADHVHLCVSIPPKLSVAEFMGYFYRKKDFIERHFPDSFKFNDFRENIFP